MLTMLPLFLSLIGILTTGFGFDRTYGNDFNVNLRMQVTSKSLLARPNVELIKKNRFHEIVLGEISGFELSFASNFKIPNDLHQKNIYRKDGQEI